MSMNHEEDNYEWNVQRFVTLWNRVRIIRFNRMNRRLIDQQCASSWMFEKLDTILGRLILCRQFDLRALVEQ